MATLAKREGKTPSYEIQFYPNGQSSARKTIYLGGRRYSEKTANDLKVIVEKLVYCRDNDNDPDKKTLAWLEAATPEIREKLAKAGLVKVPKTYTLRELWDSFLKQKTGIKDSTRDGYDYVEQRFFAFFDGATTLSELTSDQIEDWKFFLQTEYRSPRTGKPLVESSTAGTITKTKAIFNWAKTKKWLVESPLDGVGRGSFVDRENDRFITRDEYDRLLDACPCQDWRAIIALARYGGLRCPSEVLRLRWSDVNWEKDRFYVRSPKTEHHAGKEGRLVPLFSELRIELEKLFESDSSDGAEFVITRYRDPERTNLGTQFGRIVQLAGIEPVPRPFDNMRASRSTEIYAEYGSFLESQWIGHSSKIAKDHYLQVREEDFERAVKPCREKGPKNDFPALEKIFPAKTPAARSGITSHGMENKKNSNCSAEFLNLNWAILQSAQLPHNRHFSLPILHNLCKLV